MYESQQAPDPHGLRPLLTDPPLLLCLLSEAVHLGCLPGTDAAQLARSSGPKRKPSGQSVIEMLAHSQYVSMFTSTALVLS